MKKVLAVLFLLVMLFSAVMPVAMAEDTTVGIIGGADGPTAIFIAKDAEEAAEAEDVAEAVEAEEEKALTIGESALYMLKGMVGIFIVTGLIILVLVIMDKAGNRKKNEE